MRHRGTRSSHHGLDIGNAHAGGLAGSNEETSEVEVVTMASEPSDNGVSEHGQARSLVESAPNNVPSTIIVRIHALDRYREAWGVAQIQSAHSVKLPIACLKIVSQLGSTLAELSAS